MIDIYVLDKNLQKVGIVDSYNSLIWANRYAKVGDCELYVAATTASLSLLRKGYYLMREDDDMVCQIRKLQLDTDAENGNYITVTGYDVKALLDQRIMQGTENCNGSVETFIRALVTNTCISPTLSSRQFLKENGDALMSLGTAAGFGETASEQVSYKNIGEKIREYCTKYGWGYRLVLSNEALVFELYEGTDRTNDVIFADEFENLSSTSYVSDDTNVGNVALVAGEGEGAQRARSTYGYAEGVDRHEVFVDAKDISRTVKYSELTSAYSGTVTTEDGLPVYQVSPLDVLVLDGNHLAWLEDEFPSGTAIEKSSSKNLLNLNGGTWALGYYNSNGQLVTSVQSNITYDSGIYLEAGYAYTISVNASVYNIGVITWDSTDTTVLARYNNNNVSSVTIAASSVARILRIWFSIDEVARSSLDEFKAEIAGYEPQVELGSTATSYESYDSGKVLQYYRISSAVVADLAEASPSDNTTCTLRDVIYNSYLLSRGREKISSYGEVVSFEGSVIPDITFTYKEDYYLGDIVKVRNEYGIEAGARIIEVVEVVDENGYSIEPSFEYLETGTSDYVEVESGQEVVYEAGVASATDEAVNDLQSDVSDLQSDVSDIQDGYLPLSGGTLTGGLNLNSSQYHYNSAYGLDAKNSDIVGVNGIFFNDAADAGGEGIQFYRDGTYWDSLRARNGQLYFAPKGTASTVNNEFSILDSRYVGRLVITSGANAWIYMNSKYGVVILSGFAQGIGPICLAVYVNAGSITVYNLLSGGTFSNSYLTFYFNSTVSGLRITNGYSSGIDYFTYINGCGATVPDIVG